MNRPWSSTRPGLGTFVKLPATEVIELLALAGLDFVVIDNEHASIGAETVSSMIAVARGYGLPALVRVAGHAARDVQPPLDAGAAGVVLPHVDDAGQARSAVRPCRFPPLGTRGVSNSGRAGGWGTDGLPAYLQRGREAVIVAMLESPAALENAVAIASTDGIDAVLIGPADLAAASGLTQDDERLRSMLAAAESDCARSGHDLGITAPGGQAAAERITRGYRFVVVATDTALLTAGAAEAVQAVGRLTDCPSARAHDEVTTEEEGVSDAASASP
ncbi:aldolase/citrate lyase family protein [Streptomyces sp. NPDC047081]|uniref:HpcH/HpaI aldolase family protein n=1 Tax=Streptomyces sp. NPDC047081 TaxID=3154706 RepID=UPI0033F7CD9E